MNAFVEQLKTAFPENFPRIPENDKFVIYKVLNHLGDECAKCFWDKEGIELLKKIDGIYQKKQLYMNNAIENEFLYTLSIKLGVSELNRHLKQIPESLRLPYIKVLIETPI